MKEPASCCGFLGSQDLGELRKKGLAAHGVVRQEDASQVVGET